MRLTEDYKDLLRELVQSDAWPAVLAQCDIIVQRHEQALASCSLDRGPREIFIQRAKLEGARSFATALKSLKKELKLKD